MRAVLVGAVAGFAAGWGLFFLFGFVGLTGADLMERIRNGWIAGVNLGLRRGVIAGVNISVGLALASAVWIGLTDRFDPRRARPWLSGLASLMVVTANLSSLRRFGEWDEVGIVTVLGMAALVAFTVWLVTPWVIRAWASPASPR